MGEIKISELIENAFNLLKQLASCYSHKHKRGVCDELTYDTFAAMASEIIRKMREEVEKLRDEWRKNLWPPEIGGFVLDLGDGVKILIFADDPSGCHNSAGLCYPYISACISRDGESCS